MTELASKVPIRAVTASKSVMSAFVINALSTAKKEADISPNFEDIPARSTEYEPLLDEEEPPPDIVAEVAPNVGSKTYSPFSYVS